MRCNEPANFYTYKITQICGVQVLESPELLSITLLDTLLSVLIKVSITS